MGSGANASHPLVVKQASARLVKTSFAAPRITGAAAVLKHRYPSLTAKEIASALLLSANKDINNDGVNDFTGVHPVYGHGKLDLNRALNLINSR
jgi:subtilisin family serine protease